MGDGTSPEVEIPRAKMWSDQRVWWPIQLYFLNMSAFSHPVFCLLAFKSPMGKALLLLTQSLWLKCLRCLQYYFILNFGNATGRNQVITPPMDVCGTSMLLPMYKIQWFNITNNLSVNSDVMSLIIYSNANPARSPSLWFRVKLPCFASANSSCSPHLNSSHKKITQITDLNQV